MGQYVYHGPTAHIQAQYVNKDRCPFCGASAVRRGTACKSCGVTVPPEPQPIKYRKKSAPRIDSFNITAPPDIEDHIGNTDHSLPW